MPANEQDKNRSLTMAILSELLVCVLCLLIWFGGAVLVVGLLCLIFGADKIENPFCFDLENT